TLFVDEFFDGDLVHLFGKFTWENSSVYHAAGIMLIIDKAIRFPKSNTGNWSIEKMPSSPLFISFICQVLPNEQKNSHVLLRGKTHFVKTSCFLFRASYTINGFLRQILKIEEQVIFLIESTSIDYVVTQPEEEGEKIPNLSRNMSGLEEIIEIEED
ncbi:3175_t:CDS:2, partial [Diversispora eburnea]